LERLGIGNSGFQLILQKDGIYLMGKMAYYGFITLNQIIN